MRNALPFASLLVGLLTPACACGAVASDGEARLAYLGVDGVVSKVLALGFAGFNAADSANIPPQRAAGDEAGAVDVTGQVDQGASDNKGMRLDVVLTDYHDGPLDDPDTDDEEALAITYATAEGAPLAVDLQLRDIPDGTLSGTVAGAVVMEGDIEGTLTLDIALAGAIEDDGEGGTARVEGTTEVDGTATSGNGTFTVDASL